MDHRGPRGLARCLLATVMAVGLGLSACSVPGELGSAITGAANPEQDSDPVPPEVIEELEGEPVSYQLDEIAALVAEELDSKIGIAVFDEGGVQQAGTLLSGPAWSTVKVPVAVAALRENPDQVDNVRAAISESDNDAAVALWESLGDPATARGKVEDVLREAHDDVTVIDGDRYEENSRSFGDSEWPLAAQVRFATELRCMAGAEPVVEAMSQITEEHGYGLGQIDGTVYKGGWGPDPDDGAYLVRQFGLLPVGSGELGISLVVQPGDGTYETGQLALTRLSEALAPALDDARAASCR